MIFDSGIRAQILTTDSTFRTRLSEARVNMMGNGAKADEGLLVAASYDADAFIVINDRFADYPEQSAVKERRVLSPHHSHPLGSASEALGQHHLRTAIIMTPPETGCR